MPLPPPKRPSNRPPRQPQQPQFRPSVDTSPLPPFDPRDRRRPKRSNHPRGRFRNNRPKWNNHPRDRRRPKRSNHPRGRFRNRSRFRFGRKGRKKRKPPLSLQARFRLVYKKGPFYVPRRPPPLRPSKYSKVLSLGRRVRLLLYRRRRPPPPALFSVPVRQRRLSLLRPLFVRHGEFLLGGTFRDSQLSRQQNRFSPSAIVSRPRPFIPFFWKRGQGRWQRRTAPRFRPGRSATLSPFPPPRSLSPLPPPLFPHPSSGSHGFSLSSRRFRWRLSSSLRRRLIHRAIRSLPRIVRRKSSLPLASMLPPPLRVRRVGKRRRRGRKNSKGGGGYTFAFYNRRLFLPYKGINTVFLVRTTYRKFIDRSSLLGQFSFLCRLRLLPLPPPLLRFRRLLSLSLFPTDPEVAHFHPRLYHLLYALYRTLSPSSRRRPSSRQRKHHPLATVPALNRFLLRPRSALHPVPVLSRTYLYGSILRRAPLFRPRRGQPALSRLRLRILGRPKRPRTHRRVSRRRPRRRFPISVPQWVKKWARTVKRRGRFPISVPQRTEMGKKRKAALLSKLKKISISKEKKVEPYRKAKPPKTKKINSYATIG